MNLYLNRALLFAASMLFIFLIHGTRPVYGKVSLRPYDSAKFRSEKVSQTDSIILNGNIKKVFPLFGAFEERKWAQGWNPTLVYRAKDTVEEGTTFRTAGHGFGESEYIWRINKYEPQYSLIQYLVSSPNRCWTITVKCEELTSSKTLAKITYTFIALNEMGNHLNKHFLDKMYEHHLKDWEDAINSFLEKTKPVKSN